MKHLKIISFAFILALVSCTDALIGDEGKQDEDIYLNYQTITDLELPFEEEWQIIAGGKTHLTGAHHFITRGSGQRYAYDIAKIVDGNFSPLGNGNANTNEDTYTFGARINAPGDGKIISLENGIEDNVRPGARNIREGSAAGNYIMIDHLNGEYSLLAHFKKGTIIVSVGDIVIRGQEVGKAGNSGNSTGPHLHYHLQNTPDLLNGIGLPAQFLNYFEDDVFIGKGEPVSGQYVRKN